MASWNGVVVRHNQENRLGPSKHSLKVEIFEGPFTRGAMIVRIHMLHEKIMKLREVKNLLRESYFISNTIYNPEVI